MIVISRVDDDEKDKTLAGVMVSHIDSEIDLFGDSLAEDMHVVILCLIK